MDPDSLNITIREMEFEDLVKVFQLGENLFTAEKWLNLYRTWDEYELLERFLSDEEFCLIAENNNRIIGFAVGSLIWKRKSSWTYGYLNWLGVRRRYQRFGVASRLLNKLTKLFIENGARMMLVDTELKNNQAIAFFEKNGFANEVKHVYFSKNLTEDPSYKRIQNLKNLKKRRIKTIKK